MHYELTPGQKYEFDLRGYLVLRQHFDADAVAEFHAGIDELQAIPIDYQTYTKLNVASYFPGQGHGRPRASVLEGEHRLDRAPQSGHRRHRQVRPHRARPRPQRIHTELAGGPIYLSATYYIEKVGPAPGGGLHNGGFPVDRDIHYGYDHTSGRFACKSTKSVIILSDMTRVENGPFATFPGSHKANFACPFDMDDASRNPMAVPVLAAPGDVVIFSEGMDP